MLGVHAGIGPIFSHNFYFRPNAEFAFGEFTDMVALNLEGAYRLPLNFRNGRWSAYVAPCSLLISCTRDSTAETLILAISITTRGLRSSAGCVSGRGRLSK
jgi:hypothetical protein